MDDERLIVALEARVKDFERNMLRAERRGTQTYNSLDRNSGRATRRMERDMQRSSRRVSQGVASMTTSIGRFSKAFAGAAVVSGFAAIVTSSRKAVNEIAAIGDEAERAGLNVERFQELAFVANQNRVPTDALVDGFKELQLRADEFIETGQGPAADAFRRIGFDADDLASRLEEPSELFLEIVKRLEDVDRAGQIRIADEVFGGTGGERFVQLLGEGEAGIRRAMNSARDMGAVMDSEMIAKAAELDREFNELNTKMQTLWRTGVVGAAEFFDLVQASETEVLAGLLDRLSELGVADISPNEDVSDIDRLNAGLAELDGIYGSLIGEAALFERELRAVSAQLAETGNLGASQAFTDLADEVARTTEAFDNGQISVEELNVDLNDLIGMAAQTTGALGEIDGVSFDNLVTSLGGVSGMLQNVAEWAATAAAKIVAIPNTSAPAPVVFGDLPAPPSPVSPNAPVTSIRPRSAPALVDENTVVPTSASSPSIGGGRSGGGTSQRSEFQAELEQTRERIALLEAEATALTMVAASGMEYGDAVDYARKRAELLVAAQEDGRTVTPELEAQIDMLAAAYVKAGQEAEAASDKMREVEEASERGADRMADLFGSIVDGSVSAKEAIGQLLAEIANNQLQNAFGTLAGADSSGFFAGLGSLLGFSEGGYTGNGGKYQPAGIVHAGEYVINAEQVKKPGMLGLLSSINNGLPGFAQGGMVGGGSVPIARNVNQTAPAAKVSEPNFSINISPQIDASGASVETVQRLEAALASLTKQLPERVVAAVINAQKRRVL